MVAFKQSLGSITRPGSMGIISAYSINEVRTPLRQSKDRGQFLRVQSFLKKYHLVFHCAPSQAYDLNRVGLTPFLQG